MQNVLLLCVQASWFYLDTEHMGCGHSFLLWDSHGDATGHSLMLQSSKSQMMVLLRALLSLSDHGLEDTVCLLEMHGDGSERKYIHGAPNPV